MEFKVLQKFYGFEEEQTFEPGQEVSMTKKRAEAINSKLKHLGVFLERVEKNEEEHEEVTE